MIPEYSLRGVTCDVLLVVCDGYFIFENESENDDEYDSSGA
jgi:hypothetical protein